MKLTSVNGQFVDAITLTGDEPEFAYGYGVFETLRTYNGQGFLITEHLDRLEGSAFDIKLTLPEPREQIERWLVEHIQAAHNLYKQDVRVKIIVGVNTVYIQSSPLRIDARIYTNGVSVTYQELERAAPATKQLAYWQEYQAYQAAQAAGFFEVLLLNHKRDVLEGSRSNVFIVRNDVVVTPKQGMLRGTTRDVVIELASANYEVEQRKISFDELLRAEEVFITQTSTGVVPVTQIDQRQIGPEDTAGKPGKTTQHIRELFEAYTT